MRILKIKLIDSRGSIKKNNHYDFCKTPGKLTVFNKSNMAAMASL